MASIVSSTSINKVGKISIMVAILLHLMLNLEMEEVVKVVSAHNHKGRNNINTITNKGYNLNSMKKEHKRHGTKHRKGQGQMSGDSYNSHSPSSYSKIFDVLSYGAVGDGQADDTKAFVAAWQEACQVEGSIFEVPQYFTFVIRPIVLSGPCANNMIFQIEGDVVAPDNPTKWGSLYSKGLLEWINFSKLHNVLITGTGTIDGNGAAWWSASIASKGKKYPIRPTAIRFYGSNNITVQNIRILNSPQTHLKFDSCVGVTVRNISVSSPGNSPNTDGIHLQNTQNVEIHNSHISNGDDCISIQTGSSNLDIHDIVCDNGHGISLGGLGRGQTQACVSNVTVHDVTIKNSQNGLRIKTWQGGQGAVKSITYNNVIVENISNPIIIDQFYCDSVGSGRCRNMSSAVRVTGITYRNIHGTYSKSSPIHFACSDTMPCTAIVVSHVELLPFRGFFVDQPFCWNSYGSFSMPTIPPLHVCLQSASGSKSSLGTKNSTTSPPHTGNGIKQSSTSSLDDVCSAY